MTSILVYLETQDGQPKKASSRRSRRGMKARPASPIWAPMAPVISSRPSITASNMPICR